MFNGVSTNYSYSILSLLYGFLTWICKAWEFHKCRSMGVYKVCRFKILKKLHDVLLRAPAILIALFCKRNKCKKLVLDVAPHRTIPSRLYRTCVYTSLTRKVFWYPKNLLNKNSWEDSIFCMKEIYLSKLSPRYLLPLFLRISMSFIRTNGSISICVYYKKLLEISSSLNWHANYYVFKYW